MKSILLPVASPRPCSFDRARVWLRAGLVCAALVAAAGNAGAAQPDEGECPSVVGAPLIEEGKGLVDAPPVLLKEGMRIEADGLLALRRLLPAVIWQHLSLIHI